MEVADDAQVGAARRAVHGFAKRVGFTERELAEIDIVVQEIGTNAVRYATAGGTLHFAAPRPRGVSAPLRRTTHGTALLCRKWVEAARLEQHHAATARRLGAWSRPRPGEVDNGDAYFVRRRTGATLLAVVDGLGHGHGAQEAARAALEVLSAWEGEG